MEDSGSRAVGDRDGGDRLVVHERLQPPSHRGAVLYAKRARDRIGGMGGRAPGARAQLEGYTLASGALRHRAKTAALITACVVSGGLYAEANDVTVAKLRSFGQNIGLAFQIVDDILDVTQTSDQLGKTAGKDSAAEKATYPALFGVDESVKKADVLVKAALSEMDDFGPRADTLKSLARFLVERKK